MRLPHVSALPWRLLRNTAYVVLLAVAVGLVVYAWPQLVAIWRDQALTFVGAIVIMICGTLVQAHNFLAFLDVPVKPRVRHFAPVWAWSALANYVAPFQAGGIAVRVGWLSHRGVGVGESLLATWRQLIVSIWISLIGLAVGLLLTGDPRGRWPAAVLILLWLVAFFFRKGWFAWLNRLTRPAWLAQRKELLQRAAANLTVRGVVGVAVQYALGTILLFFIYARFGASIDWGRALVLCCIAYVSSLVAFLPGNVGVLDAIYMIGGHGFGLSVAQAGALAVLIRVAHIAANMLLIFTRWDSDRK